jgi:ubiquinone biosynthesis protein
LAAVERAGLDRKLLAQRGAKAVLQMIVNDGFFHADPHPGNTLYLPENRLAFIDFGMVGRLTEQRREQVSDLLSGLLDRNGATVVNVLLLWAGDTPVNAEHLAVEVDAFLDNYHGLSLKELRFSAMLGDITTIMRDHQLTMPPDLSLLFKVFISLEGLGRQLDPDFEVVPLAQPYVRQAIMARYAPEALMRRGWRGVSDFLRLFGDLPRDMRRLLLAMRKGALQINVDVAELRQFIHQMDQSASRITIGLVTSALIIGSSIVMTVSGGPTLLGLPMLGVFGFVSAGIGGVWLLISIWRGGRGS